MNLLIPVTHLTVPRKPGKAWSGEISRSSTGLQHASSLTHFHPFPQTHKQTHTHTHTHTRTHTHTHTHTHTNQARRALDDIMERFDAAQATIKSLNANVSALRQAKDEVELRVASKSELLAAAEVGERMWSSRDLRSTTLYWICAFFFFITRLGHKLWKARSLRWSRRFNIHMPCVHLERCYERIYKSQFMQSFHNLAAWERRQVSTAGRLQVSFTSTAIQVSAIICSSKTNLLAY